jgi:diguanylate cyclase (GGDEF)-like protein
MDPSGDILGILLSFKDITHRKRMEERLFQLATTDGLTGILNRREFLDRSETEFERAKRFNHELSMITMDIDNFKKINDTYGHDVGDKVLKELANIGKSVIRKVDIFGRLGGEEFGITLPETSANGAYKLAERLRKSIQDHHVQLTNGQKLNFTVSIGIASVQKGVNSLEDLMKLSDIALYKAKRLGKNRVETYEDYSLIYQSQ